MAKITLNCWVFEKTERLPSGDVAIDGISKSIEVRLAFERDTRLTNYPDNLQLRFIDEKTANAFRVGQRYLLTLETI